MYVCEYMYANIYSTFLFVAVRGFPPQIRAHKFSSRAASAQQSARHLAIDGAAPDAAELNPGRTAAATSACRWAGHRNPQFQMARRRRRIFFIQLRIFSEHTKPQKKIRCHEEFNEKKAVFENGEKVERAVAGWLWLLWLGGCGCCGCCGCCEVEHGREPENAKLVCRGSFVYFLVSKQTRTCHNVANKVVGAVGAGGAWDVVGAMGAVGMLRVLRG